MNVVTWNLSITVDGSDVTQYVINTVNINAQVETARTASFTVAMDSGAFSHNPIEDVGRRVIIEVQGNRYFTGAIRNASLNLDSRTVTYNCSDDYNERLDLQADSLYSTNQNIKYSKHVFGDQEAQTGKELLEAYLAQTDQQFTLDASGNPMYTPILQVSAPSIKTFTEANILMEGSSVSYALYDGQDAFADAVQTIDNSFATTPKGSTQIKTSVGADTKPLNEIIYEVHHRVPVLKQYNVSYTLNDTAEVSNSTRGAIVGVYFPTRAMLEEAIAKTGWHLIAPIAYTDIPQSNTYTLGGTPVGWVRSTEAKETLFQTALFTIGYRWITYLTEVTTKVVRCTESIAKYGLNSEKRTIAIDGMSTYTNLEDWKAFKDTGLVSFTTNGYHSLVLRSPDKIDPDFDPALFADRNYLAQSDDVHAADQAAEVVEKIADAEVKREVVGKTNSRAGVNTTTLTFKVTFDDLPNQNVGYRAEYSTSFWQATGTITAVDWNFGTDGSALASVTLTSVTEAAQRAVKTGSASPTSPGDFPGLEEGGSTFYPYSWEPDGNGGYTQVKATDSPTTQAYNNARQADVSPMVGAVPGTIPTFIRGVDNWGTVGIAPTDNYDLLPQGYYANNSNVAPGFLSNGNANTEPDLPSGLIVLQTPDLRGLNTNENEISYVKSDVIVVPYVKDTFVAGE